MSPPLAVASAPPGGAARGGTPGNAVLQGAGGALAFDVAVQGAAALLERAEDTHGKSGRVPTSTTAEDVPGSGASQSSVACVASVPTDGFPFPPQGGPAGAGPTEAESEQHTVPETVTVPEGESTEPIVSVAATVVGPVSTRPATQTATRTADPDTGVVPGSATAQTSAETEIEVEAGVPNGQNGTQRMPVRAVAPNPIPEADPVQGRNPDDAPAQEDASDSVAGEIRPVYGSVFAHGAAGAATSATSGNPQRPSGHDVRGLGGAPSPETAEAARMVVEETAVAAAQPQIARNGPAAMPMVQAPALPELRTTQLVKPIFALATSTRAGEHTMTMDLKPDLLGKVTVKAHIGAEGVRVELFAASDLGRDALKSIMADLRRDLAGTGLKANLDLSANDHPGSDRGPESGHRDQARDFADPPGSGAPRGHTAPAAATRAYFPSTATLDVFA